VKDLLGSGHLKWDENRKQGAYKGQKVYDHTVADHSKSLLGHRGAQAGSAAAGRDKAPAPVAPNEFPQYGEFYGERRAAPPRNALHPAQHAEQQQYAEPVPGSMAQFHQDKPVEHVPGGLRPLPARARALEESRLASEEHVFGNTTAASILKTRPW
jgi:hypothetical protein